jgi:putative transposase
VWLSGFELQKLTAGFSKCEGVHVDSRTVQQTCKEFATRLRQFRRQKLNWRVSNRKSPKYSPGWVPFKGEGIRYRNGQLHFKGVQIGLWDSYGLSRYERGSGSFNEDSRGRWYVNIAVKVQLEEKRVPHGATTVGIDLGLKTMATYSDGTEFAPKKWYRESEQAPGIAQRARKKRRVKAIHARIANQRKDAIHKETTALVKAHAAIFVGDVNESAGKNGYGEIRTRCRMDDVQDTTQVQSHQAMRGVRRGQRSVFDPDLFVLRDHSRQQSER